MLHQQGKVTTRGEECAIGIEAEDTAYKERLAYHCGDWQKANDRKDEGCCDQNKALSHESDSTQRFRNGWMA